MRIRIYFYLSQLLWGVVHDSFKFQVNIISLVVYNKIMPVALQEAPVKKTLPPFEGKANQALLSINKFR